MSVVIFALGIKSTNGLVKSTINTANAFVKNNIDTTIINTVGMHRGLDFLDPAFPLDNRVKKYSLDALYLNNKRNITLKQKTFYSLKQRFLKVEYTEYHKEILKEINKKLCKDDLVIFTHPLLMHIYVKANPDSTAKKLIQVHGNYIEEKANFKLLEGCYDKVDYIQSVSRHMNKDMVYKLAVPTNKAIYIPNICTPINLVKNKVKYTKRISIVGSIQDRKNQLDAVRMLTYIEDSNVILQIIGNSLERSYEKKIKDLIKRKGVEDRVRFLGVMSERDIYENSDILILPSKHEGFGYTFLECSLYKIPTVAYEFDYGSKEFLSDLSQHCLVKQGDFRGLAERVSSILEDKKLYNKITSHNYKYFTDYFSEEHIIKQYIKLLGNNRNKFSLSNLSRLKDNAFSFSNIIMIKDWLSYRFSMKIEENIDDISLYYLYKDKKYNIQYTVDDSIGRSLYRFKIPRVSIASLGTLKGFYIIAEGNDKQEHYLGFISKKRNYEVIYNHKDSYPVYTKEHSIEKLETQMDKSGLFIRYPSPEAILSIHNEYGEYLQYETKLINNGKEYQPYFSIKSGLYKELSILMNSGCRATVAFNNFSYAQLFKTFCDMELKHNLYEFKVADTYIWELIRVELFENMLVATGVLDTHFTKNVWKKPYIHTASKSLSDIPKNSTIIFEFPRKNGIDYKTSHMHSGVKSPAIIEYPQHGGYSEPVYNPDTNIYPIEKYIKHRGSKKLVYSRSDRKMIDSLSVTISKETGLNINLFQFIDGKLKKFRREYNFFENLFKKVSPVEVIIASSYWSAGIIAAAKAHSILTSDIQYALLSSKHPSYAFPESKRHYGAKRIYIWSDYWNIKTVPYNEYVVTPRNYFLDRCKYLGVTIDQENTYDIAFVSQSRIGSHLLDIAFDTAKAVPSAMIVYCPHPDEDISGYAQYVAFSKLANTCISTDDTLKSISVSKNVVGVYSTTMMEALALGKNVYIASLSGHRVLHREIEKGYFATFSDANDLLLKISSKKEKHNIDFCKLFYGSSFDSL